MKSATISVKNLWKKGKPEIGESGHKGVDQELLGSATEMEAPLSSDEDANALAFVLVENNDGGIQYFRFHSDFTILRPKTEEYE